MSFLIEMCKDVGEDGDIEVIQYIDAVGGECMPMLCNNDGESVLVVASRLGQSNIVMKIISTFGEDCLPNKISNNGQTALLNICKYCNQESAHLMIDTFGDKLDVSIKDPNGMTALIASCTYQKQTVAMKLLDLYGEKCDIMAECQGDYIGNALVSACYRGYVDIALKILEIVKDDTILKKNNAGASPLAYAVINKMNDVTKVIFERSEQYISDGLYTLNGVTITMFMLMCKYADENIINEFLTRFEKFCQIDYVQEDGQTIIGYLIERKLVGIVHKIIDKFGETVMKDNTTIMICKNFTDDEVHNFLGSFGKYCSVDKVIDQTFPFRELCRSKKEKSAILMLEMFGEKAIPKKENTIFLALCYKMKELYKVLIEKYQEYVAMDFVILGACLGNMDDICSDLIDIVPETYNIEYKSTCLCETVNLGDYGCSSEKTVFELAIARKMSTSITKMIDKFGERVLCGNGPIHIRELCKVGKHDISLEMIKKFGDKCVDEELLTFALENKFYTIVKNLIHFANNIDIVNVDRLLFMVKDDEESMKTFMSKYKNKFGERFLKYKLDLMADTMKIDRVSSIRCNVCYDDILLKGMLILKPCNHGSICEGCIEQIRKTTDICPECRVQLTGTEKVYI